MWCAQDEENREKKKGRKLDSDWAMLYISLRIKMKNQTEI